MRDMMGIFKKLMQNTAQNKEEISEPQKKSLYKIISEAVINSELPRDFSLPEDSSEKIKWADGAKDGVRIYHMGSAGTSEDDMAKIAEALDAAAGRKFEKADDFFCQIGKNTYAISLIDDLQKYVLEHKEKLDANNVYAYSIHAITESSDRECVKFGLSLLELFNTDNNDQVKEIVRTLGLSDEFTIFAVFIMTKWKNGNDEVWKLAQKVHGWGRIHAVERIEPVSDEIKRWFLIDAVHNDVMLAYSALTCWFKSGAYDILKNGPKGEEYRGIRDILSGLLNEGPVAGISQLDDEEDIIMRFLDASGKLATTIEDYDVVRNIRVNYEDDNEEVVTLCNKLLGKDECRKLVVESVKKGDALVMAKELGVEYHEDAFAAMEKAFEGKFYLCSFFMDDPEYKDKVMGLFRDKLPLSDMITSPSDESGLGKEYWKQHALESMMQNLKKYPMEGQDFVMTALQSAPVSTRNGALNVLESWVSNSNKPLSELLPEFSKLLERIKQVEPNDNVKVRIESLLEGKTSFQSGITI